MIITYYGRFNGPANGIRILAEVYKSTNDEGLVMDSKIKSRHCFTQWGAKKWIEKQLVKLSCNEPKWYYVHPSQ